MDQNAFHSLFLPLGSEERAVYTSFLPLLSLPQPCVAPHATSPTPREEVTSDTVAADHPTQRSNQFASRETMGRLSAPDNELKSPLFALLSSRADALLVVLRNRQVVFFHIPSVNSGPVELKRFFPTKYTAERSSGRAHDGGAEVSCVSLIPLDIAYTCRVELASRAGYGVEDIAAGPEVSSVHSPVEGNAEAADAAGNAVILGCTYLRGIVGCTDGRVSVFSERGYAFSFSAHDSAVSRAEAVYCADDFAEEAEAGVAPHSLRGAMRHLGFVTEGMDGRIFLWRRTRGQLKPNCIVEPGLMTRHIAFSVYQPPSIDWLLSPYGGTTEGMLLHSSIIVHSTSTIKHGVQTRCMEGGVAAGERYAVPGPWYTFTTAIATTHQYCLAAREKELYAVDYASGEVTLIMTAARPITSIVLSEQVALAVCGEAGVVYILQLSPFAVVNKYHSYKKHAIASCTLTSHAMIMVIVDSHGLVELVKLPDSCCPEQSTAPLKQVTKSASDIPTVDALRCQCHLEREGLVKGGHGNTDAIFAEEPIEGWVSAINQARTLVPEQCEKYLPTTTQVV